MSHPMSHPLVESLQQHFGDKLLTCTDALGEVTIEVAGDSLLAVCQALRDEDAFQFSQLIDVCGVDYQAYGQTQWQTEEASGTGFGRGVDETITMQTPESFPERFAVVYHLLSITHNQRLRVRVFVAESQLVVPSVCEIWSSANWFEREAFDLYGLLFDGHPDLRRILTDYGFVGHPFRKDFPLSGQVEMRYDAQARRCVYEPVSIEPRTLVPRVIRHDQRYAGQE